jgi:hypothetical protein
LLELGRAGDDPGDDAVARNRSKLALKVGAAALGAGTVAGSATHAAAAVASSGWVSGTVIAICTTLLVGGAAAGVYALQGEATPPVVSAVPQPGLGPTKPADAELEPPIQATTPAPEAAAPAQHEPLARATPPAPSVAARSIQNELELIRTAQKHLHRGDARGALAVLSEHARRYPAGALSEEREASRVFALCGLGDAAGARRHAERFLRRAPNSPFAERVRASCRSAAR